MDTLSEIKQKNGELGEQLVAEFLLRQGYTIRARNWRPRNSHLEVDIIAQQGTTLIFVEVKTRNDADADPSRIVDRKKRMRLIRAARIYLESQPEDFTYRFDIVKVTVPNPESDEDAEIVHLPDAFMSWG